MFPTAHYVFLLVVYGVLLVDARPINLTTSPSVSPTQFELLTEVDFGGRIHNLIPFPKPYQGKDADYYELGGAGQPAILKVVERNDDSRKRLNVEGFFLKKVELFLGTADDEKFYYLALRDVRSRYPYRNSPSLKLAHEWYLEDKTMDVQEMLNSLRNNIETTLVDYVREKGLYYSHVTFDSIYTDKRFEYVMPVNWGPPTESGGRGVKQSKDVPNAATYYDDLENIIGEQINIDMLARVLEHHGERLRLADGGPRDTVELADEEYDLKPLVAQGMFSQVYTIVGGYEDQDTKKTVPAILKIAAGAGDNKIKAETEIGYLKTVGLYLYAKLDEYNFYLIVMRDVRTGFPKKNSPPLKPFYEWYQVDKKMDSERSWKKFRKATEERLIKFAEKDGLLYNDYHLGNIFVDRKLKVIMPIDWGPPGYAQGKARSGVEEITTQDKKERKKIIKAYKEDLRKKLPEDFNSEKLASLLGTS